MADDEIFYLPPDDPDLDRPYITAREFQEATKTAVRTISTDFDTSVSFAGEMACTDGNRVILPQVNPERMMTHREVNVGRGYANHESLHKLLTDFKHGQTWMKKMMNTSRPFTVHMGQAIEDVRIEHGGQSLYAGISKSIDKTAEQVCKEFKKIAEEEPKMCKDPWKVLPVAVTWIGRMKLGYPSPVIKQAFDNLSDDIKKRAELIASATLGLPHGVQGVGQVDQALAHNGSRFGMELAEKVANELAKDIPPPPVEEIAVPHMAGDTGSKTKGKGKKGEANASSGADAGKQDEKKSSMMSGQDKSEARGHGSQMSPEKGDILQRPEPTPFDPELNQVLKHFTPKQSKGKYNKNKGAFTYDDDSIEEPEEALKEPDFYRSEYKRARDSLGSKLGTMRRKLEKALITKTEADYETSRVGKLNIRKKSAELFMGGSNIRRKRTEGDAIDTAVSLLVDCSGSMSGQPMVLAGHSAIALSECLSAGGVPYEVLGHTTLRLTQGSRSLLTNQKTKYETDKEGYSEPVEENRWEREEALYMPVFKPFDKPLNQCKHLMGFIPNASHSCNADADALLYAGERLMKRRETNKILMLIADGYPAWHGAGDQNEITRRAVVKLNRDGIKTIGLGINCDSVKQFFERWVVVNEIDDLSKHVLDQVAKMILGQRFHIDNSDLLKGESNGTK
jgi:cobalamin biosynthesis protein CobT